MKLISQIILKLFHASGLKPRAVPSGTTILVSAVRRRYGHSKAQLRIIHQMAATAKYCGSHFYPILISLIFFIPDIFPQQEKGKRRNTDVRQTQQHQPFAGRKHACQNTENKCHSRKSRYVLPAFAALYRRNNTNHQ